MDTRTISNIKYFRYVDESKDDLFGFYELDDEFSRVFEIVDIDNDKQEIIVKWLEDYEEDTYTFPFAILDSKETAILDTHDFEKRLAIAEEKRQETLREQERELAEKITKENEEKDSHFLLIKPKYKRGVKVLLIGKFDHSLIEFTVKTDAFFVDDVIEEEGTAIYSLRVSGRRKNRGIYVFRTKFGFLDENLKEDVNQDSDLDFDYRVVNGTIRIAKE